ncbi:MAG: 50S ribosomal protein L24 [Acidobacteriota bacterium]|jgi:large subunit ribosomal protein L24|nr:50S ribosomal protein L24 [Acidobacteriota bacterium]
MAAGIRKNDIVLVRQGKDKGKTGKVIKVDSEKGRALVERLNFVKEFIRPDRSKNRQGGIMEREAPIPLSRLMLYCEECAAGVRPRSKRLADGTRQRICPKCDGALDKAK